MLVFVAWQITQTLPYFSTYGVDTLRDASVWGYSAFAWIVAALVIRLDRSLDEVIRRFKAFAGWYVFLGAPCALATQYYSAHLPSWPGTSVTIPGLKCGDLCVHLAGITALLVSGLAPRKYWWLVPIILGAMMGGAVNRGGLLATGVSLMVIVALTLRPERMYALGFAGVTLIVLLVVLDPQIPIPVRSDRTVSFAQVLDNIRSIGNDEEDVGGTKQWRLKWWNQILGYTVYGDYFWTGKGYGINLATSDRMAADASLRSPHNSHLTLLARSGVPGFLLWALLQIAWLAAMLRSFARARVLRLYWWSSLFAWLVAYWAAFMTNAAFDVALEGPMLAIPFWTVFGLGWGGTIAFHRHVRARRAVRHVGFGMLRTAPGLTQQGGAHA
jgi:O-antigen ligase